MKPGGEIASASSWPYWPADWPQVLALYTAVSAIDRSPVVTLNGAIALRYVPAPEADRYLPAIVPLA